MNKILSHEISKIGRLDIALHNESAQFYNLLEANGLIEHLKKLDHLGFISQSHPGNNHKRWDYVMLQLFLLHKLKHGIFNSGLSHNHQISEDFKASGIIILQIAVLFSNIGHLPGTLASEISLFNYLIENPQKKKEFLNKINRDKDWKKYAKKIFEQYDYYKVKYLIGLNFLLENIDDLKIKSTVSKFFLNSMEKDDSGLRKLKWIFFKVRQISFIYLDSFNSDFPFNIEINKILLNTYNYSHLFNPNSSDYDSFFDSCETTLTKKLYVSQRSICALNHNEIRFKEYLMQNSLIGGENKLDFKNFIYSFISRDVKHYELKPSGNSECYQFYISSEDFEIFGTKFEFFNYKEAIVKNYQNLDLLNSIANFKLKNKPAKVFLIHDQRRFLFYNNIILDPDSISEVDQNQFILNYLLLHKEFLSSYKYDENIGFAKQTAIGNYRKNYCRKVFLQLFKIIFKCEHKLSAYIKFEHQKVINDFFWRKYAVFPTGYFNNKSEFMKMLNQLSKINETPAEISNTHRVLIDIVKNISMIKRNFNVFYCLFPIEIERTALDTKKLYELQISETSSSVTDIDGVIAIFNKTKFEFYIIEGKASGHVTSDVKNDFLKKIKPNLRFPESMPEISVIRKERVRGGYVCFKNF